MSYSSLADVIVAVHFGWIFYVLIGQLLILIGLVFKWEWIRNFWFRFSHLAMMLLVAVESTFGIDCPLTIWEKRLRGFGAHDGLRYTESDSFIARWLGEIIFIDDVPSNDWRFTASYLGFAALVVLSLWLAPPRRPMTRSTFIALIHLFIGGVLLATYSGAYNESLNIAVGVVFAIQGILWYTLQERANPPASPPGRGAGGEGRSHV